VARPPRAREPEGFREDLYYRLAQTRVTLPALAERPEDIPLLVQHFLARIAPGVEAARTISEDALRELQKKAYPGNVRELLHTVERAAMLANGPTIQPSDLAFERILNGERSRAASLYGTLRASPMMEGDELPLFKEAKRTLVDEFERDYLEQLITRVGRNLSRASVLAGVERHHLRELLKKHGLRGNDEG
jgi:DNA-binding NtrC family response regulator